MPVNDTAVKLASEIRNSKEYKEFRKYMKEIKKDKESEKLLKDYRNIQIQVQGYIMKNQEIDRKTTMKLENIKTKIASSKKLCSYLNSEQKFTLMMNNINKILAQAVEKDYK